MAALDETPSAKRWLPLEANPEIMNQVFLFLFFNKTLFGWEEMDRKVIRKL